MGFCFFVLIKWTVLCYGLMAVIRYYLKKKWWGSPDLQNEESAKGKVVIVTGANSGTGKAASLGFAARDATVIMACRSESKAKEAEKWIRSRTWRGELVFIKLDLSSLDSVREFVKTFKSKYDKLDILVNNAGLALPYDSKMKTKEGFEIHMGVHHLGHFLLTNLLLDRLKNAKSSRVVTVSSTGHSWTPLDIDDLFSEGKPVPKNYFPLPHYYYTRSKLANALFNKELAKRMESSGVNSYALCPGAVYSDISQHQGNSGLFYEFVLSPLFKIPLYFAKSIEEGADTILHCALNKHLAKESGEMYQNCGYWEPKNRIKLTEEDARKLWEVSEKLVGL